jgi:hypothetical protein
MIDLIREKQTQLNPRLCINILDFLVREKELVDESDILRYLFNYIDSFHFNFTYDQLLKIENSFFLLNKKLELGFSPKMANYLNYSKSRMNADLHKQTLITLDSYSIPLDDKRFIITVGDMQRTVKIHFRESGQTLKLMALPSSNDAYDMILNMRKILYKEDKERVFIIDRPPLLYSEYQTVNEILTADDDLIVGKAKEGINLRSSKHTEKSAQKGPLQMLSEYLEIPLLDKENLRFYLEKIILKNKTRYFLKEAEKIVNLKSPYKSGSKVTSLYFNSDI